LITTADLKTQSKADLAKLAKRLGISGFGSMRKEDLVVAVAKASKSAAAKSTPPVKSHSTVKSHSAVKNKSTVKSKSPTVKKSAHPPAASKVAADTKGASKQANGHPTATKKILASTVGSGATRKAASSKSAKTGSSTTMRPSSSKSAMEKPALEKGSKQASVATKPPVSSSGKVLGKDKNKSAIASHPVSGKATGDKVDTSSKLGVSTESAAQRAKSAAQKLSGKSPAKSNKTKPQPTATDPQVLKRIRELQMQRQSDKDIAFRPTLVRPPGAMEPIWEKDPVGDRIALFVRDAHWMHASWDITRQAIDRAKAAMLEQWHGAKPILRLIRMDDTGTTTTSETVERDIEIHGGSRNWYIEWSGEPASFRVLIGYLATNGRFHIMAKSNIVKTPGAGSPDAVDEHWSDLGAESERIYAISGGYDGELETGELKEILEDRVHRTLGAPPLAKLGAGADSPFRRRGGFHFEMDVELVVYGSTVPDGYLTLNGEPVKLRSDGSFALRVPFPDRRQVLPAVACSRDGSQQRTIVVAVERNTKVMEPLESEQDTGE
jgi:uncharacterized protein